jgi:hypothetical protein
MEAHNILWGELLGGLLILGCSAALVIRLWPELNTSPWFKLGTFVGANAAVYGAGLYTLRRWRLAMTSQGLLLIGVLLTPLAVVGLTLPAAIGTAPGLVSPIVGMLALAPLLWLAAEVLVPRLSLILTTTVAGLSATLVVLAHCVRRRMDDRIFIMWMLLLVAVFLIGTAFGWSRQRKEGPLDGPRARSLLALLGIGAFTLAISLGMALHLFGGLRAGREDLGPPIALAALLVFAVGLMIHRELREDRHAPLTRMTGTTLVVLAFLLVAGSAALSWPEATTFFSALVLVVMVADVLPEQAWGIVPYLFYLSTLAIPLLVCAWPLSAQLFAVIAVVWLVSRWVQRAEGTAQVWSIIEVLLSALAISSLLAGVTGELISDPVALPTWALAVGTPLGWFAALLTLGAAAWYTWARLPWLFPLVFTGVVAGVGPMLVCTLSSAVGVPWQAYHLLMVTWIVGSVVLAAIGWKPSWIAARFGRSRPGAWRSFPGAVFLGLMVLVLGLRGMGADPSGPPWPVGAIVFAAAIAAMAAVRWRAEVFVLFAAALAEVALIYLICCSSGGACLAEVWPFLLAAHVVLAAGIAVGWRVVRLRLGGGPWSPLLRVQSWLAIVPGAFLVLFLAGTLIVSPGTPREVAAGGSLFGWLALGGVVLVCMGLAGTERLFDLSAAAVVLVACTAAKWDTGNWLAYHVLAVALALLTAAIHVARGWVGPRPAPDSEGPSWMMGAHLRAKILTLVVGALAIRSAFDDPGRPWWPIALMGTWALLGATLAWQQRDERWALLTALGAEAVAVLWSYFGHESEPLSAFWLELVQAFGLIAAISSLFWLALRDRFLHAVVARFSAAPLLAVQVFLTLAAVVTLVSPVVLIIAAPADGASLGTAVGQWLSWLTLVLTAVAARWYARAFLLPARTHFVAILGIAGAALLACTLGKSEGPNWLAYHVFVATCATLTVFLLFSGRPTFATADTSTPQGKRYPTGAALGWVLVLAVLLMLLAVRGAREDPWRAAPSAAVLLCVAAIGVDLSVGRRTGLWALVAVVPLCLAVSFVLWSVVLWHRQEPWNWEADGPLLAQVNLLTGGLSALFWLATGQGPLRRSGWLGILLIVLDGGNIALLARPAVVLIIHPEEVGPWMRTYGNAAGWAALLSTAVAMMWYIVRIVGRVPFAAACALVLVLGVPAACTAAGWEDHNFLAYHTLLVTWAGTGTLALLLQRRVLRSPTEPESPQATEHIYRGRSAAVLVGIIGLLIVSLAIRGAFVDPYGIGWSVAAVVLVSFQAAVIAVWRRSETWAGIAILGLDLTVTLLVWDRYREASISSWWAQLLQANILAGSVAVLLWWLIHPRRQSPRPAGPRAAPLLSIQTCVGLLGNAVLLLSPVMAGLVWSPGDLPPIVAGSDGVGGWLSLLATAVVVVIQLRLTHMHGGAQVLTSLGVGVGVLAACTAAHWDQHHFLAYHVLLLSWVVLAALLLLGGWIDVRFRVVARRVARDPLSPVLSEGLVRQWLILIGLPVAGLAVRAVGIDPTGPWWSVGAVVAMSLLAFVVGVDQRREGWVFAAALGLQLAVLLAQWRSYTIAIFGDWPAALMQTQLLAVGLTLLVWLAAVGKIYPSGTISPRIAPLLTLFLGLGLVATVAVLAVPAGRLLAFPGAANPLLAEIGTWTAWLSLLVLLVALGWYALQARFALSLVLWPSLLVGVVSAGTAARWALADGWLAYHTLIAAWAIAGIALTAMSWWRSPAADWRLALRPRLWSILVAALLVMLALRGISSDSAGPWWSVGAVLSAVALVAMLAAWGRHAGGAFIACLGIDLAVSLLLWHSNLGRPAEEWWVPLLQVNAAGCAAAALIWLAVSWRIGRRGGEERHRSLFLAVQCLLGRVANAAVLVGAAVLLVEHPQRPSIAVAQAGSLWGWLLLPWTWLPSIVYFHLRRGTGISSLLTQFLLAVAVLAACSAATFSPGDWMAYHVLQVGVVVVGLLVATLGRKVFVPGVLHGWVVLVVLLSAALALRSAGMDSTGPWFSAGGLLAAGTLAGASALTGGGELFVWASGLLLAAVGPVLTLGALSHFLDPLVVGTASLAAAAALWAAIASWRTASSAANVQHTSPGPGQLFPISDFAPTATLMALSSFVVLAGFAVAIDELRLNVPKVGPLAWAALVCVGTALALSSWGLRMPLADRAFYLYCLAGVGLAWSTIPRVELGTRLQFLSAFVTAAEAVRRVPLRQAAAPRPLWFHVPQWMLGALVVGATIGACIRPFLTWDERLKATAALAILLPAAWLLVRTFSWARDLMLLLIALLVAELAWIAVDPTRPQARLDGYALFLSATCFLMLVYILVLPRVLIGSPWPRSALRIGGLGAILSMLLLGPLLTLECLYGRAHAGPPLGPVPLSISALALVAAILTAVAFAISEKLNPLLPTPTARVRYLYLAEALLAALVVHLHLAGALAGEGLLPYWPFAIIATALVLTIAAEALRRSAHAIHAGPLYRTSLVFPIVPLAAFWLHPVTTYSAVWFVAAALYGLVAIIRWSLPLSLLAVLIGNIGLWILLHENKIDFLRYPQAWALPAALTVLIAAQLNRDRLRRSQLQALRYGALSLGYAAATAETFLAGPATDGWRPLALIALAVAGALAGMFFRVRAFLFLGSAFVLMGVVALVWHAAASQSWVWYAAGIAFGVALIALFAIIEKRREMILALLHRLREWE